MSGKYALIIGNNEYIDSGLAQLRTPGKDAEDFARVLKDKEIGAFDDVKVIVNESSASVIEAIDEFFDQKKPDDMLVLYFSGHGIKDEIGSLYLAFKNTIRSRLRSTAIKSDYIKEAMDQSRSKRQVLILDCCNSGAFPQGTKAELGGAMGMPQAFQGYGRFVLTASDATQFAWEGDKVIGETDNSLFTHFLVKGLEGEADSDGDGKITVDELYDFAYNQISRVTPKQTPTKSSSKVEGEIVLRPNMRIEDIKPIALPDDLISEVEDLRPLVREGAVQRLEKIIKGKNIGMARSALEALEKIASDENTTRRVAQLATQALEYYRQAEHRAEAERKAKEEAERLAILKAEEERLTQEKAKAERKAKEEAERLAFAKAQQEAAELEAMRLKAERESTEKAAKEAAEKVAKEKAEKEIADREVARLAAESEAAREKAEHDAALQAERDAAKLATRKKAEREAAQKAENEAMELAARRKAERESTEKVAIKEKKTIVSSWMKFGLLGGAIIGLVLCGFVAIKFLPAILVGAPAATQASTQTSPSLPDNDLLKEIKNRGYILVSTDPNYEPQSFLNTEGKRPADTKCPADTLTTAEMQGFDVDVAVAVGDALGVQTCFATPSWEMVTAGNWADKWDMSIGSMIITTERQKVLDFSVPYYYDPPAVVAVLSNSGITSLDQLAGKAICAGASTTYETWLNGGDLGLPASSIFAQHPANITVVPLTSDQECAQALAAGSTDFAAYVTSRTVLNANIAAGIPVMQVGTPVYSEDLAAAFDKSSTLPTQTLRDEVDKLFAAMHNDGRLTGLSKKWFSGEDLTQAPANTLNTIQSSKFPLTIDAYNATDVGDGSILYYSKMSLEDVMKFYRDIYTSKGYTERKSLTTVSNSVFSIVFDGDPSGKAVVIQSVDLGDGSRTVTIRLEDV